MQSVSGRAPETLLSDAYRHFFESGQTFSQLQNQVLQDRLFTKDSEANGGVAGRSLAWKLFLTKPEPLQANLPPRSATLLEHLRESRRNYEKLLTEKTKAPDDLGRVPERLTGTVRNLTVNDPLSLHNENPWHDWFNALELKKTILQDVERTFPDIAFFREDEVQDELTNILLVYSLTHPSIGYRQGMHELLAPLYHAVYFDSVGDESQIDTDLRLLCSRKHVGADSWGLFDTVMQNVAVWYEWQQPDPKAIGRRSQASLSGHVHLIIPDGQNGIQPYVAPIVKACNKIQNELLKKCDPALWKSMENSGIEPQIYGIRWLRMLFTREFPMPDSMKLWDGLFACDPTLDLALWVCVAMLIRVRNDLIPADYNGQLTTLLRYPSPPQQRPPGSPTHTCILLQQALFLQMAPNPASSATIAMENRTAFNIPIEVPPPAPLRRRPQLPPPQASQSGFGQRKQDIEGSSRLGHSRQASTPTIGIPEMLARGLLERGESLGINKTLYSAVAELKRNIPDIAANLMRSPNPNEVSFPLEDENPVPPWEPRSRLEVEGEVANLKTRDKRLGDALGWIVDTLLQDESSAEDVQRLQRKRREAIESLAYVRDVLISDDLNLDHERLIGEEEALKRKRKEQMRAEESKLPPVTTVAPPLPVSTIDSRTRHVTERAFARSPPRPTSGVQPSPSAELQQAPPWNYTRSSFSTPTGLPPGSLPRKPPPTSTGTSRMSGIVKSQDPLGAL
ncbi:hypothetical protein D9611_004650 [Ephemerocybe angulata]|uniref:Rab-GAP TBC domain-containing protein n=1 Tax=Ephemerocybe angulata TaxID=980116 RepID=A0A8H5EX25_9AGAR|nr:hypothetical protein D9611_004650 [Tulosesus angulatus]